jgi:hypothetical protein
MSGNSTDDRGRGGVLARDYKRVNDARGLFRAAVLFGLLQE